MELDFLTVFVSDENKAGKDEEYSVLYMDMENLINETSQVENIGNKPLDYKKLENICLELWKTTRDLRVAVYLTFAQSQLNGLRGLYEGVSLVEWLIVNLWEEMYPALDPEDDKDPTERLNILQILSPNMMQSQGISLFLIALRDIKLFKELSYTLRDLLFVQGEIESVSHDINTSVFYNETRMASKNEIEENISLLNMILSVLEHIDSVIYEKTYQNYSFSFDALKRDLTILLKFYNSLQSNEVTFNSEEFVDENNQKESKIALGNCLDINAYIPQNRQESLLLVQRSIEYFRKYEPTNPAPFLLERALRIAEMNFIDLLKDIEPSYVDRIKDVLGVSKE